MSWEFKNLKTDLANKNIAQLAATMWHGINVTHGMTELPKRAVGFLTSLRQWIMVTAKLENGVYKWRATPVLTTVLQDSDAAVDVDVCDHVATLLCYAFSNAKLLHEVAVEASLRDFDFLEPSGPDGENGTNPPDDDPNDDNDGNHGPDTTSHNHGRVGADKVGRSEVRRRPLGNVDSNCTAPLTIRNVEKYDSMTWSQMPLDRFKTAPTF
jgi:hypothetical protein